MLGFSTTVSVTLCTMGTGALVLLLEECVSVGNVVLGRRPLNAGGKEEAKMKYPAQLEGWLLLTGLIRSVVTEVLA